MATKALSAVFLRRLLGLSPCSRYATAKQWKVKIQPDAFPLASLCPCSLYCTSGVFYRNEVDVTYRNGLPVISVPLPSRRENCEFTLKPITHTVGDFIQFLNDEDGGIDRASVYTTDGLKIAKSTTMDILLQNDFRLVINDQDYSVAVPDTKALVHEDAEQMSDVKNLIATLYSSLHIDQHQLRQEKDLQGALDNLRSQLAPYEKIQQELADQARKKTASLSWLGLGLMGCQFGVLARLTWWEYSWDIMEPVTYFITYGTSIAMFAYFVLTKQEYNFAEVKDRAYLLNFYKAANKQKLDVERYNELKNQILITELDLQRLRDPLELHLPLPPHKTKPQAH